MTKTYLDIYRGDPQASFGAADLGELIGAGLFMSCIVFIVVLIVVPFLPSSLIYVVISILSLWLGFGINYLIFAVYETLTLRTVVNKLQRFPRKRDRRKWQNLLIKMMFILVFLILIFSCNSIYYFTSEAVLMPICAIPLFGNVLVGLARGFSREKKFEIFFDCAEEMARSILIEAYKSVGYGEEGAISQSDYLFKGDFIERNNQGLTIYGKKEFAELLDQYARKAGIKYRVGMK